MLWSGDYSQCVGCCEVYPYAITECPCCHNQCKTYVSPEGFSFDSGKAFELIGEQRQVLSLPPKGAVLIKGGAGSGKTLVSVKRAEYLMNNFSDLFQSSNVAIFAYNKELVHEIQNLVSDKTISVYNVDSWIYRLLINSGKKLGLIKDSELKECRLLARKAAFVSIPGKAIAKKSDDFYAAEICWLKGRRISTLDEYKQTKRTGRGTEDRVTSVDREYLWKMFEAYNIELSKRHIRDWEDRVLDALEIVEKPNFRPPYTHIVLDEAQDFSFAKIALIRRLITPETESLTIVADSAQQIYQSGFSWADLGIRVVGRSVEFKRNYRNTRQISEAAYSLMSHEKDSADFTHMENSQFEGAKPIIAYGTEDACGKYLRQAIKSLPSNEDVVIALPAHKFFNDMEQLLKSAGISVTRSACDRRVPGSVRLSTYHALKGLQFSHVFLWSVTEKYFSTHSFDPEAVSKSRKLLYVAMTRATRTLTIFSPFQPSGFLSEIDPQTIVSTNIN